VFAASGEGDDVIDVEVGRVHAQAADTAGGVVQLKNGTGVDVLNEGIVQSCPTTIIASAVQLGKLLPP